VTGIERRDVRPLEPDVRRELAGQPVDRGLTLAPVHPEDQAQRPHVPAAQRLARADPALLHGLGGESRDVELEDVVGVERPVREGVRRVTGLAEIALAEGRGVHQNETARLEVRHVDLERRRVHRDEHVQLVARGADLRGAELDLIGGHPEGRAGGGADLGREIGEGREVVSGEPGLEGEPGPGELHAVARVPREADHRAVALGAQRRTAGPGKRGGHGRNVPRPTPRGGLWRPAPRALRFARG